ncbi:hypothetical protein AAZX31_08G129400 [Glycine max]|nr:hypothetical protein GmHk_08G022076 [Glycine max]
MMLLPVSAAWNFKLFQRNVTVIIYPKFYPRQCCTLEQEQPKDNHNQHKKQFADWFDGKLEKKQKERREQRKYGCRTCLDS